MFYNYKNFGVFLNGQQLLAIDAQISETASINETAVGADVISVNEYAPAAPVEGLLRFSYYLTGRDTLKAYIEQDNRAITGNFGGIYFSSGYLVSYGINGEANKPVIVDAQIKFFEPLKGTFAAPSEPTSFNEASILNFSDVTITNPSFSEETISNITNFTYNFELEANPVYYAATGLGQKIEPAYISFGERRISSTITSDSLITNLPASGVTAGVTINFKHPSQPSLDESVMISGKIFQKNINAGLNDAVSSTYSIVQHYSLQPQITSFSPSSGGPNTIVTILGENLDKVTRVLLGRYLCGFTIINSRTINVVVPNVVFTGFFTLITPYGNVSTATTFASTNVVVSINQIVKKPLKAFGRPEIESTPTIIVTGENFYDITNVTFADGSATGVSATKFEVVSPNILTAVMPSGIRNGMMKIISSGAQSTGQIYLSFPPVLNIIYPNSGISGQQINVSGKNLYSATGFYFYRYTDSGATRITGYTINSDSSVTLTLPSGNMNGVIRAIGSGNTTGDTPMFFRPSIAITGINPASGKVGDMVLITGYGFEKTHFNLSGENKVKVKFSDYDMYFDWINFTTLSGTVPTGNMGNPVKVYRASGFDGFYDSNIYFSGRNAPSVSSTWPTWGYSGKYMYMDVRGDYFYSTNRLIFSGELSSNNTTQFELSSSQFQIDNSNQKITTFGFYLAPIPTGRYTLFVRNPFGSGRITGAINVLPVINYANVFGIAYQSSVLNDDYENYGAQKAVDGLTGDMSLTGKSISITQTQVNPYWEVDFQGEVEITRMKVYNRLDSGKERFTGLLFSILDRNRNVKWSSGNNSTTAQDTQFHFGIPNITGKFFRVEHSGNYNGDLALGEVQVF